MVVNDWFFAVCICTIVIRALSSDHAWTLFACLSVVPRSYPWGDLVAWQGTEWVASNWWSPWMWWSAYSMFDVDSKQHAFRCRLYMACQDVLSIMVYFVSYSDKVRAVFPVSILTPPTRKMNLLLGYSRGVSHWRQQSASWGGGGGGVPGESPSRHLRLWMLQITAFWGYNSFNQSNCKTVAILFRCSAHWLALDALLTGCYKCAANCCI